MQNTKTFLFTTLKKLCAIIGYRSAKFLVSFSEASVKLRIVINRILFYVFYFYCDSIGASTNFFSTGASTTKSMLVNFCPYFLVFLFLSFFLCCCLVSFWEYRL